ncbi:MAG: DUF3137 domain-containing protein [Bacteroidota bacterium]
MAKIERFGKHKRKIWQLLAEQLEGDFIQGNRSRPDRVEAFYGDWMVSLDSQNAGEAVFTRIRAPYVNRDDFIFRIIRETASHRIAKKFGMSDIEVGYPAFDKDFVIQGSDERKLKMMFANPKIRELITYQPRIMLQLRREAPLFQKPKFPKGVNELYFQTNNILTDLEQLHDLFELFAHTLDHLCAIGTAYEDDPHFRYHYK